MATDASYSYHAWPFYITAIRPPVCGHPPRPEIGTRLWEVSLWEVGSMSYTLVTTYIESGRRNKLVYTKMYTQAVACKRQDKIINSPESQFKKRGCKIIPSWKSTLSKGWKHCFSAYSYKNFWGGPTPVLLLLARDFSDHRSSLVHTKSRARALYISTELLPYCL